MSAKCQSSLVEIFHSMKIPPYLHLSKVYKKHGYPKIWTECLAAVKKWMTATKRRETDHDVRSKSGPFRKPFGRKEEEMRW